ncbi:MAG TPA: T9SS type A sorting domain-containing protein [Candidatus Cloacimonadota bacterium]|nr:T9SS type A sorting domain-containing protein [Candidatus Cloacimonadota bacterium]
MKTQALIMLLLMLICTAIFASENPSDAAEYARKTQELNDRADRFKAETGFEGDITYNHQYMNFSQLYGTFNDIHLTAPCDTVLAGQALDQIMLRFTPFTLARESQLVLSRHEHSRYMVTKIWKQVVNGYSVHPGGIISVSYNIDTQEFIINDATVDIPNTPIPINISKEDAKQIMINEYKKSEYYNGRVRGSSQEPSIAYNRISTSKDPLQYRLYWSMMFFQVSFSIDVETLEIHQHMNIMMYNMLAVKGKTYKPTISGLVFDPTTPPESSLRGINVMNGDQNGFTDPNGCIQLSLSPQENYKVSLRSERWDIRSIYNESTSLNVDYYTEIDPMSYETNVLDFIDTQDELNPAPPSLYAANIYYHLQNQDDFFTERSPSFSSVTYPVIYNDNEALPENDWGGVFEVNYNTGTVAIHYYNGFNPYIIMHELSHFYTFNRMNSLTFSGVASTMLDKAMDEAFAEYWLGRGLVTNSHIRNYNGNSIAIDLLDIYDIHSSADYNNLSLTLNEDFYSWYYCGMPIAAVWEDIRTRLWFDDFDIKLLGALTSITVYDQDLSKPRYFYNVLMRTSTPNAQMIIDKAYSDRGFHFTPRVISAGSNNPNKEKNKFRIGDPVHVKITNCPQNTPLTVYIVEDQDYTDGMNISSLSILYSRSLSAVDIGDDGSWTGELCNSDSLGGGEYDILVDIGNNGVLHFAYNDANIRDGFDGLTGHGFTVYDDRIEVVLAQDISWSMVDKMGTLQNVTQSIISAMSVGDRLNVFAFNEGSPPLWDGGTYSSSPTIMPELYEIRDESEQITMVESVQQHIGRDCTDLSVPFEHGWIRFGSLSDRNKGIVLLSDGLHTPTCDSLHLNDPFYSNPHTMDTVLNSIITHYCPVGIRCYTMGFETEQSGFTNMNSIADTGCGIAYHVPELDSLAIIASRLINSIRGNPPTFDKNFSIPPNSNHTIQFSVDVLADKLKATTICDTLNNDVIFTMVSPSGVIYNQPINICGIAQKICVDSPESGIWTASITNNYSTEEAFSLICEIDSDLTVSTGEIPSEHAVDSPLLLQVAVADYYAPISSAIVNATIRRGSWRCSVNLFDDGNHDDGGSGDGVYANYLYAFDEIVSNFPLNEQCGVFDLSIVIDVPSIQGIRVINRHIYLNPQEPNPYPAVVRNLHNGWNWVGFPRLTGTNSESPIDIAAISLVPNISDLISDNGSAYYANDTWTYNGITTVKSKDGYKIRIRNGEPLPLYERGTIVDTLSIYPLMKDAWNWLTYPCYELAYPEEALGNVIESIDYIMAEEWSMRKIHGVWEFDKNSRKPILRYGDSIMVRATDQVDLVWNAPNTIPDDRIPLKTSYYTYVDNPDYETLMIESIENAPDYLELGVFQGDTCIGARVFEGYPMQVLAYSDSTCFEELEIKIYTGDKGEHELVPIKISSGSDVYSENRIYPTNRGFRTLTLRADEVVVPPIFAVHGNFPNPFNPSTIIKFSIPDKGKVKLTVYNLRGQKVKELVNEEMEPMLYSVVWDGRDETNRRVGSGVYFYKLQYGGKSVTRKMALMK